eukprot:7581599-Alexandrium_andersonii.AAC.1
MMRSMAEEAAYGVSLRQAGEGQATEVIEEAAEFVADDPFVMMSGMATEEVYRVTLMVEAPDCAIADDTARIGGAPGEKILRATLLEEGA